MKSAIFQAALVVLGVVLAFAANEWRQSAAADRASAEALASIREELEANRGAVAASAAYHGQKLGLIAERSASGAPLAAVDFPRGFVSPATLSSAAWTSASETGALANLPYAEIVKFSRLYDMQAVYLNQTRAAGDIIYQRMFEAGPDSIPANASGLAGIIGAFRYREQALVEAYDAALR